MPSATDFLPSYITEFMNLEMVRLPYLASGLISRFSAEWRRDIGFLCLYLVFLADPGSHSASPRLSGMTFASLRSLGPLGAVLGTALLAVLDALGVEHAAQDVVAHARQVLDAAAADHDRSEER